MKAYLLVFMGLLMAGCHNYSANVGEALGCTLAGNGCDDGRVGPQGAPGVHGGSCTVSTVAAGPLAPNGGAQVLCDNGSNALILNGAPGVDGAPSPSTPYTITKVITPCPSLAGAHREVLLVMANRSILASASESANGKNTRLALLGLGGYVTTDGRACAFTVTSTSVSWAGGSESY